MLRLPRPLFWLKYCTKDLHQTFKTRSSISSQTGCPYDPLSGQLLILGSTYQEAQSYTAMAVSLLESLGFTVNLEKSSLNPTQIITFLGFVIDSTVEALSPPQEKVVKMQSLCLKAKVSRTMPARQIAHVLGTLESCRPAI